MSLVPNVPCGVESTLINVSVRLTTYVPNVPCGVESLQGLQGLAVLILFLMYRVELKGISV